MVIDGIKSVLYSERQARKQYMKDMDADVKIIKDLLNEKISSDYSEAVQDNAESKLGIDSRYNQPWFQEKLYAEKRVPDRECQVDYVKRTIQRVAPWQKWA